MTPKDAITFLTYALLREQNTSPQTNRIFKRFLTLKKAYAKSLEISSDSTQNITKDYFRPIIFHLRRHELTHLLAQEELGGICPDKIMFLNDNDTCFGVGINDSKLSQMESRIKIYNFYSRSQEKINVHEHLETICGQYGINPTWVAKDYDLLGKIRISCSDLYLNGSIGLKVYSQFFLTKDLFGKYQWALDARVLNNYKKLFNSGCLPPIGEFCIRYYNGSRSIRVGFMCYTRRILPFLDAFDLNGAAARLYQDIVSIGKRPKLTFITIDFNKKPKIQFYFNIWNGESFAPG